MVDELENLKTLLFYIYTKIERCLSIFCMDSLEIVVSTSQADSLLCVTSKKHTGATARKASNRAGIRNESSGE